MRSRGCSKVQEKGWTLIPLDIHLRDGRAKVEIGLAHGKKLYDNRESIAKHEHDREMRRAVKDMLIEVEVGDITANGGQRIAEAEINILRLRHSLSPIRCDISCHSL